MIYGLGVGVKYDTIISGRRAELYAGLSLQDQEAKHAELGEFMTEVKNCTPAEFDQWYQLYVDTIQSKKTKKP